MPLTPGIGRFAGAVDVHEHDSIGICERIAEIPCKGLGARVAVRLEEHDDALEVQCAGGGERRAHLGRVVGVVVDDGDSVDLPDQIEPAPHSGEARERSGRGGDVEPEHPSGGRAPQSPFSAMWSPGTRVTAVTAAPSGNDDLEARPDTLSADHPATHVAVLGEPVGDDASVRLRGQLDDTRASSPHTTRAPSAATRLMNSTKVSSTAPSVP